MAQHDLGPLPCAEKAAGRRGSRVRVVGVEAWLCDAGAVPVGRLGRFLCDRPSLPPQPSRSCAASSGWGVGLSGAAALAFFRGVGLGGSGVFPRSVGAQEIDRQRADARRQRDDIHHREQGQRPGMECGDRRRGAREILGDRA